MMDEKQLRETIKSFADAVRSDTKDADKTTLKAVCSLVADAFLTFHAIARAQERQAEALERQADSLSRIADAVADYQPRPPAG